MKKKVYTWFNPPPRKYEKIGKETQTVPGQVHSIRELLRRHMAGQQVLGKELDWNSDFPEDEIPLDQKQNLDLTDIDQGKKHLEDIKRKIDEVKNKEPKEKILKNVPLNKQEAESGKGTEEDISDIKTNKKSFDTE